MQKMHLLMQIRSSKYTVYVLDTVVKSRQIQIYANESLVYRYYLRIGLLAVCS